MVQTTCISMSKVDGAKIYKESTGNTIAFNLGAGTLPNAFYGIALDHCDGVYVHENYIDNSGTPNSSTNLRGLHVVDCQAANICSNVIKETGYAMYFEGDCANGSMLKLNVMEKYNKAIYFNNAKFNDQASNTETWDNTFDNSTNWLNVERLSGSLSNTSPILWFYNSNDPTMDVSGVFNGVINFTVTTQGCSGCNSTACETLPQRQMIKTFDNKNKIKFLVYPNPSDGFINIQDGSGNPAQGKIVIFDSFGRAVFNSEGNIISAPVNVMGLAAGFYLIQLSSNGQVWKGNFILQH